MTRLEGFVMQQPEGCDNLLALKKQFDREIVNCQKSFEERLEQNSRLLSSYMAKMNDKLAAQSKEILEIQERITNGIATGPQTIPQKPEEVGMEELFEQVHKQDQRIQKIEAEMQEGYRQAQETDSRRPNGQSSGNEGTRAIVAKYTNSETTGAEQEAKSKRKGNARGRKRSETAVAIKKGECFNCGKTGHTARNCHSKKTTKLVETAKEDQVESGRNDKTGRPETGIILDETNRQSNKSSAQECLNCKKVGHLTKECRASRKCFKCGSEGHLARRCSKGDHRRPINDRECHQCGGKGHLTKQCPNKGQARHHPGKGNKTTQGGMGYRGRYKFRSRYLKHPKGLWEQPWAYQQRPWGYHGGQDPGWGVAQPAGNPITYGRPNFPHVQPW